MSTINHQSVTEEDYFEQVEQVLRSSSGYQGEWDIFSQVSEENPDTSLNDVREALEDVKKRKEAGENDLKTAVRTEYSDMLFDLAYASNGAEVDWKSATVGEMVYKLPEISKEELKERYSSDDRRIT